MFKKSPLKVKGQDEAGSGWVNAQLCVCHSLYAHMSLGVRTCFHVSTSSNPEIRIKFLINADGNHKLSFLLRCSLIHRKSQNEAASLSLTYFNSVN